MPCRIGGEAAELHGQVEEPLARQVAATADHQGGDEGPPRFGVLAHQGFQRLGDAPDGAWGREPQGFGHLMVGDRQPGLGHRLEEAAHLGRQDVIGVRYWHLSSLVVHCRGHVRASRRAAPGACGDYADTIDTRR